MILLLYCNFHWSVPGDPLKGESAVKRGYVLITMSGNDCLLEVSLTRKIEALKNFLPGYDGIVEHDSYTGWLHIGDIHQLCMSHQLRLTKKDMKYLNLKLGVCKKTQ